MLERTSFDDLASESHDEREANVPTPTVAHVSELTIAYESYCVDTAFSSVSGPDPDPRGTMEVGQSVHTPLIDQEEEESRNSRNSLLPCTTSRKTHFCVLFVICVTTAGFFFLHLRGTTSRDKYPVTKSRSDKFQACASHLSPRIQCPDSQECKDMQSFFMKQAEMIEINEHFCSWNSDFGLMFSLILIRDSLSLRYLSWHPVTALKRAKDVCKWKRIKCDEQGVIELGLSHDASLNGTLPTELGGLVDLKKLVLFSNQNLLGTIPSEIGMLSKLTSIQLHQSSISGEIPTEMSSLTNLVELLLDGTELSGTMPAGICELQRVGALSPPHVSCHSVSCTCCKCRNLIKELPAYGTTLNTQVPAESDLESKKKQELN